MLSSLSFLRLLLRGGWAQRRARLSENCDPGSISNRHLSMKKQRFSLIIWSKGKWFILLKPRLLLLCCCRFPVFLMLSSTFALMSSYFNWKLKSSRFLRAIRRFRSLSNLYNHLLNSFQNLIREKKMPLVGSSNVLSCFGGQLTIASWIDDSSNFVGGSFAQTFWGGRRMSHRHVVSRFLCLLN